MKRCDLHLVSWNRPKMTDLVIRTIKENTKPGNYRLVVLDNGSDGDTPQMLEDLHNNGYIDELFTLKTNLGLETGRNFLLNNSTHSDYFICVDNDCLPPPIKDGKDWVERLYELIQVYPNYKAISARTQVMIGTGDIFAEADEAGDEIVDFPHPGGSLRIMDTRAVFEVGGWARGEKGRGAEERYICGKLREAGYKTAFATQIHTLHLFGTRGDQPTDRWGYEAKLKPEDTGHSDIAHPALTNGDDYDEIVKYAGEKNARRYYD